MSRLDPESQPLAARPQAVTLRARRSPKLVAAGLLTVALGAIGAAALYTANNEEISVISLAKLVPRGQVVTADDLAVVQVPERFAVDTHPAEELDAFVGRTALVDLPEGTFPVAAHVGEDPLPDGQALVGLRLAHGQLPVSAMPTGTAVELVDLSEEPGDGVLAGVVAVAPEMLDDGASYTLDVRVDAASAQRVARLAALGELALVVVGEA